MMQASRSPQSSAWGRWLLPLSSGLLALVLALGLAALPLRPERKVPPVTLADGTVITLEATTFGTQEWVAGAPLQRFFHRLFRTGILGHQAAVQVYRGSTPGALTFWITRRGPDTTLKELTATTFDEAGNESSPVTLHLMAGAVESCEFTSFPRRGRITGLRFYARQRPEGEETHALESGWQPLGEIAAPNPAPHEHPTWDAPALPVTVRAEAAEGVEVTLSRLETGVEPEHTFLQRGPADVYCLAALQVRKDGKRTRDWTASVHSLSDATGNRWYAGTSTTNEERTLFPSPPWPGEAAWKLRLQLSRTQTAAYTSQELWEVPNVPLPRRGQFFNLGKKGTRNGVSVELVGVYGLGTKLPSGYEAQGHEDVPLLLLRVKAGGPAMYRTPLRMHDERGREVRVNLGSSTSEGGDSQEVYRVQAEAGTTRFRFRYAVHPAQYLEILTPKSGASSPAEP